MREAENRREGEREREKGEGGRGWITLRRAMVRCAILCCVSPCLSTLFFCAVMRCAVPVPVRLLVYHCLFFGRLFVSPSLSAVVSMCFSKPLTSHNRFMFLLLVVVSSTFSDSGTT